MSDGVVQWVDAQASEGARLLVECDDGVDETARDHAVVKLGKVLGDVGRPVLYAMLRLTLEPDPARERPAIARVTIDADGQPIRACVAARTMDEAVDILERRLRDKVDHLHARQRHLRRRGPAGGPGEWRHGDLSTPRPSYFDRPVDERRLVRRKTFMAGEMSLDEAAFDLDMLDYEFYLFRDLATGLDTVVFHEGDSLAVATTAPELDTGAALERLDAGHEPWVFFRDSGTGRGRVVYRRYDGHYGLVAPADDPPLPER